MLNPSISEADKKTINHERCYHCHPRVRLFLGTLGMKRRKIGMIPAKADVEQQEVFKKTLEVRLEEAKNQQRAVFFVDAAHFVFAPFLGYLWCFARRLVRAPSGRQRFNVLGALNAITHEWQ